MAIPDHNQLNDHEYEESIDQWICSQCFKTISSTRPPVFNPENCSCVEVGGGGTSVAPPRAEIEQPLYSYNNTTDPNPLYHNNIQSYASSAVSFQGPEGPEREGVNMRLTNAYLPLGPDTGLNELQHRRSASFESNLSYPMRRFLVEEGYNQTQLSSEEAVENRFLQQDVKMGSSKKVTKGSKFSWVSGDSAGKSSSDELAWSASASKDLGNVGAWMEDNGVPYGGVEMQREGNGYPMVMSGLTEYGFGNEG